MKICSRCKTDPVVSYSKSWCKVCLNASQKRVKKRHRENGKCPCGRQPESGKKICQKCLDYRRIRRTTLREKGLCPICGKSTSGKSNCARCLGRMAVKREEVKREVFESYGGAKCACCGNHFLDHLELDHIHGNGGEHRRQPGNWEGNALYRKLRRMKYPSGYQVLCANCNKAKSYRGVCKCQQGL